VELLFTAETRRRGEKLETFATDFADKLADQELSREFRE